jgi:integrase
LSFSRPIFYETDFSPKTVNDIFTIVRGVWTEAFEDGIIKNNPTDRIRNIERDDSSEFADPFTRDELELIANGNPTRMKDARMTLFNCWVGLSVSELVALALEDVDKERGGIHARRAKVAGEFKAPKERSRIRFVELISPAYNL